jgi:hypothetical protein
MKYAVFLLLACCGPKEPTFTVLQEELFSQSCAFSSCHGSAFTASRLDLRAGKAFTQLVGKPSEHEPTRLLVVPGDPDASYLIDKLYGKRIPSTIDHPDHADLMPPAGSGTVSEELKSLAREWVARGAKND